MRRSAVRTASRTPGREGATSPAMITRLLLLLSLTCAAPVLAVGVPAEPYVPDDHTLFLHHFDGETDQLGLTANLAQGAAGPAGLPRGEPRFVAGKFGKALVCSPNSAGLSYSAGKNLHPSGGTIEFWVTLPDFDAGNKDNMRFFFTAAGKRLEQTRLTIGLGRFNSARTGAKPDDIFADLLDGELGLRHSVADWKPNEWHHLALLWDREHARLVVDGVRVAEGAHSPLEPEVHFAPGGLALCVIDELRISDIMRTELEVHNAVTEQTRRNTIAEAPIPPPGEWPELPRPPLRPAVVKLTPGAPNLFIDDYLVESADKLLRRPGEVRKYEGNPVLVPEGLWEETAAFPFGGGVYRLPDGTWQMWYNTYIRWLQDRSRTSVCYATSGDGIRWQKPKLGLVEVRGSKDNNVVLAAGQDNASVIYDPADPDPQRRYKLVAHRGGPEGNGLYGYTSPDGIHFAEMPHILVKGGGDRSSLWHDTLHNRYVMFSRFLSIVPRRLVFEFTSGDFAAWTPPQLILKYSAIDQPQGIEHYGAAAFAYGDVIVGFLEMFHYPYRRLDTQLICSRDGLAWERVCDGQVFLPNGPQGAFDEFWAFPATSPPVRAGDELWVYYQGRGSAHPPPDAAIWPGSDPSGRERHSLWAATGLAKLRLDGFAYLHSTGETATLTTVPLQLRGPSPEGTDPAGRHLFVNANADNMPHGSSWLKVGLLDESFTPLPGFAIDQCEPMRVDSVAWQAKWSGAADLRDLREKPFRLQFQCQNTRLYSFTLK